MVIESFFGFTNDKYTNKSSKWITHKIGNVSLHIQPRYKSNKFIDNNIVYLVKNLENIGYTIIDNRAELCKKTNKKISTLTFRLTDSENDGDIPYDIKCDIISRVRNIFKGYMIEDDDFPSRGYIIFNIILSL